MKSFIRMIVVLAIISIVIISCLLVFDVASYAETKDTLQKVLLALGIVALGGAVISFVSSKTE